MQRGELLLDSSNTETFTSVMLAEFRSHSLRLRRVRRDEGRTRFPQHNRVLDHGDEISLDTFTDARIANQKEAGDMRTACISYHKRHVNLWLLTARCCAGVICGRPDPMMGEC